MEKTREEIVELYFSTMAILRKAQCRAVNCDVIDSLDDIASKIYELDELITEIIGD